MEKKHSYVSPDEGTTVWLATHQSVDGVLQPRWTDTLSFKVCCLHYHTILHLAGHEYYYSVIEGLVQELTVAQIVL